MIRILGTVLAGLLGLAFGSFLNVCLSRWPEGESVVAPSSHCRNCGRSLAWWENAPVLSWLALGGRCRTCRVAISWRYPLVELAVGALWAVIGWRFFSQFESSAVPAGAIAALAMMAFVWLLVAVAALDVEHLWIPDAATVPGIAIGLVLGPLTSSLLHAYPSRGSGFWLQVIDRALAAVIAASIVLLIRWTYWLIRRREGIGVGDAKLLAMLGAWLGLPGCLVAFAIGVVLGAVVGLAAVWRPKGLGAAEASGLMKLPLGAFLSIGGVVSALWGQPILAAYLHWAGFN